MRTCLFRLQHQRSQGKTLIHPGQLSLPLPAVSQALSAVDFLCSSSTENGLCSVSPYRTTSPLRRGSSSPYSPVGSILPPGLFIPRDRGEEERARQGSGQPTTAAPYSPRDSGGGHPPPKPSGAPIPGSAAHILSQRTTPCARGVSPEESSCLAASPDWVL